MLSFYLTLQTRSSPRKTKVMSDKPLREQSGPTKWRGIPRRTALYAALYLLGAILFALTILATLLKFPDRVIALGLAGSLYYLILLLVPLLPAAFLFGFLDSIGEWRGSQFGGTLKLGGGGPILRPDSPGMDICPSGPKFLDHHLSSRTGRSAGPDPEGGWPGHHRYRQLSQKAAHRRRRLGGFPRNTGQLLR